MPPGLIFILMAGGFLLVAAVAMMLVLRRILHAHGKDREVWKSDKIWIDFPSLIHATDDPVMEKYYRIMWRVYLFSAIWGAILTLIGIVWLFFGPLSDQIPFIS